MIAGPQRAARRRKATSAKPEATRPAPARPSKDRITILVVDDNYDVCAMYARHFRFMGATVLMARDGIEALQLARQYGPDAVLLDLAMPRLTGWEVVERLRREDPTKNVPVVAISGHVFAGAKEHALRSGADLYLTKPCPPDTAFAKIIELLGGFDPAQKPGRSS